MATQYNPQSVTNGLVYCVDAANPRSFNISENLLTYSEQLDNAAWAKSEVTITANATLAPDGTLTADKVLETVNNTIHNVSQNYNTTAGTSFTYTVYLKAAERTFAFVGMSDLVTGDCHVVVDLIAGTLGSTSIVGVGGWTNRSFAIDSAGNGWWRVRCSGTTSTTYASPRIYTMQSATTAGYAGSTTSGVFMWGAQLEKGLTASPYTQTVASTVTRSTNWTDMIGGSSSVATNGPQFNNNNAGYFNMAAASVQYFQHPVYSALDITNNLTLEAFVYITTWNHIGGVLTYGTDAAEQYALWTSNGGQFVFSSNWPGTWYQHYSGSTLSAGSWYHVVATFASGTAKFYINGVLATSTTSFGITTLPAVSSAYLTIGNNHPGGDEMLDGRVGMARIYNRVLSLQEVQLNFNACRGRYGI